MREDFRINRFNKTDPDYECITSVKLDVLHRRQCVPPGDDGHCGDLSILTGFGRSGRRRIRGVGTGWHQGIVVLIKRAGDLVDGARNAG